MTYFVYFHAEIITGRREDFLNIKVVERYRLRMF